MTQKFTAADLAKLFEELLYEYDVEFYVSGHSDLVTSKIGSSIYPKHLEYLELLAKRLNQEMGVEE